MEISVSKTMKEKWQEEAVADVTEKEKARVIRAAVGEWLAANMAVDLLNDIDCFPEQSNMPKRNYKDFAHLLPYLKRIYGMDEAEVIDFVLRLFFTHEEMVAISNVEGEEWTARIE